MASGANGTGQGPTTAQLKADIDSGRTRQKVDFPDPAASPLGTDAEAGGAPPTPQEVSHARREERHVSQVAAAQDAPRPEWSRWALIGLAAIVLLALVVWFLSRGF